MNSKQLVRNKAWLDSKNGRPWLLDLLRREAAWLKNGLFFLLFVYFRVRSAATHAKISLNQEKNPLFLILSAPVATSLLSRFCLIYCLFFASTSLLFCQSRIVVANDGSGDFRSIQAAINSLPAESSTWREVYIRNGNYPEKIYIEKNKITLTGQSVAGVVITVSQARDCWRCAHPDDWGAATMNLRAQDITLQNLTVINSYGFNAKGDSTITCANEANVAKVVRKDGHQFALRSMPGCTRLSVINCVFRALGGDTVSPWDVDQGMYYFRNCVMEGGVDFYCPRGWAYAEDCTFICHNLSAAIWHDGSLHESSKTVLKNCTFKGDPGFKLGRFHRESQFYLLQCRFAKEMADADIYWAQSGPGTPLWGKRVFYYRCKRSGGDYGWHQDNLSSGVKAKEINVSWTFDGRWTPPGSGK